MEGVEKHFFVCWKHKIMGFPLVATVVAAVIIGAGWGVLCNVGLSVVS